MAKLSHFIARVTGLRDQLFARSRMAKPGAGQVAAVMPATSAIEPVATDLTEGATSAAAAWRDGSKQPAHVVDQSSPNPSSPAVALGAKASRKAKSRAPRDLRPRRPAPSDAARTSRGRAKPRGNGKERWSLVGGDWPRIGGRGFVPAIPVLFASPAFRERFRPGERRAVYVLTCPGSERLSSDLAVPLAKIGTCGVDQLKTREGALSRLRYAGVGARDMPPSQAWSGWRRTSLAIARDAAAPSGPVRVAADHLVVTLPAGMSAAAFDEAFDAAVRLGAIDVWADTEAGLAHCRARGVDPARLKRATLRRERGCARPARALEIAVYRPNQDAPRLVEIAERIVLRHLGLCA